METKTISKAEAKRRAIEECKETLRKFVKPGDTVYTSLLSVSSSGMSRHITVHIPIIGQDEWNKGELDIFNITGMVARVLGYRVNDRDGALVIGGCGMDMGHHVVYSLGRALFRDQKFTCIGSRCPSNDHTNGDRNYRPHVHSDEGYSLRQRWL